MFVETEEGALAPQSEALEAAGPEPDDGRNESLETLLWRQSRYAVIEAYRRYHENPAQHGHDFWCAVSKFARNKLYPLEHEFKDHGTAETVDDFAQEVLIEVWETMPQKKFATPAKFYAWINRLCFTHRMDAGEALRKAISLKVPLFLTGEDGEEFENPLLNPFSNAVDRSYPEPPAWIEGIDREMVILLMGGKTYEEAAKELRRSPETLKDRAKDLKREAKSRRGASKSSQIKAEKISSEITPFSASKTAYYYVEGKRERGT